MDSVDSDRNGSGERTPLALKILIAGGFGAGKTTLVGVVSEVRPLQTEEILTDAGIGTDDISGVETKKTTTVAMDFGRITINDELQVYLFGTPGQNRFWFLWDELAFGALGAVVLADTRRLADCFPSVDYFERRGIPFVIGVNCFDGARPYSVEAVRQALDLDPDVPVVLCDVRSRQSGKMVRVAHRNSLPSRPATTSGTGGLTCPHGRRGGGRTGREGVPMGDPGEFVHVGCYTPATGGRGDGIVVARRDLSTGALTVLGTAAVTPSPSFLARHPALPVLYAVNELPEGTVSAWTVRPDGELIPMGSRATGGDSPCHLAVCPGGRQLFVANYGGGSVAVHPLDEAGAPGERTDLVAHDGHGADPERQDRAHTHMVSPDPGQGPLLAVDLGTDSVYRYDLDPAAGRLLPRVPRLRTPAGTGPRHLARHPDGRRCYVVGELSATVTEYEFDAGGVPRQRGQVPASELVGHVQPAEVGVSPDGRFLYVANRGIGTIAVFALDAGPPRHVTEVATGGEWPRHFARIGDYLYVADERAHFIRVFAVDPRSGVPAPVGEPVEVPSPVCILPAHP